MLYSQRLAEYPFLKLSLKNLLDQYDEIMTMATKVTQVLTGMPGGGGDKRRVERAMDRLIDLAEKIDEKAKELSGSGKELIDAVYSLPPCLGRTVLELKYLKGPKTIKEIAQELHYSERSITEAHNEALRRIDSQKSA